MKEIIYGDGCKYDYEEEKDRFRRKPRIEKDQYSSFDDYIKQHNGTVIDNERM